MPLHSLVVHPDAGIRHQLTTMLAALGGEVIAFAAPERRPSAHAQLALVGGPAAADWIREIRAAAHDDAIHVVWADRAADLPDVEPLLACGADDFVALDDDHADVARRLALALRRASDRARVARDERDLRSVEERFDELTGSVREILWITSADMTRALYLSPAYEAIVGRSRREHYANASAYLDFVHPDDVPILRAAACPAEPIEYRYRLLRGDGSIRWLHTHVFPIRDDGGLVHRYAGIARDVTEHVETERALEARQRLLEGVAQALATLLADAHATEAIDRVLSEVGRLAEVEDVYVAEHRPREDGGSDVCVVHRWTSGTPPPTPRVYRSVRPLHEALSRGEALMLHASALEGEVRALLDSTGVKSLLIVPVFLDGRCWGQIGLFDPRAERVWGDELRATLAATAASIGAVLMQRRTLQELHAAHERAAEQAARIHALYDAVSNPMLSLEAQLERVLATGCRLLGADVGSVTRVAPEDESSCTVEFAWPAATASGPGTRVPLLRAEWEDSVRSGEPLAVADTGPVLDDHPDAPSHRVRSFLGAVLWVRGEPHGALNFVSSEPRAGGFRGTDLDIAQLIARWVGLLLERMQDDEQRRRLEARFREAQKLESLGLLAGGVAHDFNNLLMVILGHASLAARELPHPSPAREAVEQIAVAAKRSAELTRQMLAFAGREPRRDSVVLLADTVEETVKMLAATLPEAVGLSCELEKIPAMYADGTQLRRVVMNLVTNAAEAIGESGGHIVVRTGIEHAGSGGLRGTVGSEDLGPGRYAYVEVQDDGCGIGAGTLARIFDPFFSTKLTGRGLGLATALGIVRSHRGAIRVTTEPGRGTTFRALLPLGSDEVRVPVDEPRELVHRVLGRVLVVDDDDAVRKTVAAILVRNGLEVIPAASGAEAVALVSARGAEIDLVLLDVMMPGMDGPTTLRALRALRPRLSVVLMSGYTEALATRVEGEPVEFIQKPFSANELLARIAPALRPG